MEGFVKVKSPELALNFEIDKNGCLDFDDIKGYFPGCTNLTYTIEGQGVFTVKIINGNLIKVVSGVNQYDVYFPKNKENNQRAEDYTFPKDYGLQRFQSVVLANLGEDELDLYNVKREGRKGQKVQKPKIRNMAFVAKYRNSADETFLKLSATKKETLALNMDDQYTYNQIKVKAISIFKNEQNHSFFETSIIDLGGPDSKIIKAFMDTKGKLGCSLWDCKKQYYSTGNGTLKMHLLLTKKDFANESFRMSDMSVNISRLNNGPSNYIPQTKNECENQNLQIEQKLSVKKIKMQNEVKPSLIIISKFMEHSKKEIDLQQANNIYKNHHHHFLNTTSNNLISEHSFPQNEFDNNSEPSKIVPKGNMHSSLQLETGTNFVPKDVDEVVKELKEIINKNKPSIKPSSSLLVHANKSAAILTPEKVIKVPPKKTLNSGLSKIQYYVYKESEHPMANNIVQLKSICNDTPPIQKFRLCNLEISAPIFSKDQLSFSNVVLGRGGFGEVREGRLNKTTPVAIKSISLLRVKHKYIIREIYMNDLIRSHENIVPMMGICQDNFRMYIVMQLSKGTNLRYIILQMMERVLILDVKRKSNMALQMCRAIDFMHSLQPNPVIHKDLKPENILVDEYLHIKICDLGISSKVNCHQEFVTTQGVQQGTTPYMPPEMLLHEKSATKNSDIWSLGCCLVEMFSLTPLWDINVLLTESTRQQLISKMKQKLKPNVEQVPDLYKELICSCFDYDENKRPTAESLYNMFENFLNSFEQ